MSKPSLSASSRSFSACSISFSASKDSLIPSALRAGFGVLTVAWLEADSSLLILRDALANAVRAARCDVGISNALGPTNPSTHMRSVHRVHSSIQNGLILPGMLTNAVQLISQLVYSTSSLKLVPKQARSGIRLPDWFI
jgi:hypothetical protein